MSDRITTSKSTQQASSAGRRTIAHGLRASASRLFNAGVLVTSALLGFARLGHVDLPHVAQVTHAHTITRIQPLGYCTGSPTPC
jgi:hypothetical protein